MNGYKGEYKRGKSFPVLSRTFAATALFAFITISALFNSPMKNNSHGNSTTNNTYQGLSDNSITGGDSMSVKDSDFKVLTAFPHKWPESIDMDNKGNLYFTDTLEGRFYRMSRKDDNTFNSEEELINNLKRASGISIDRVNEALYLGAVIETDKGNMPKVFRIPLIIFNSDVKLPLTYESLIKYGSGSIAQFSEWDISRPSNGIIFDNKKNSLYYTYERLGLLALIFRAKGHLGRVLTDTHEKTEVLLDLFSPNGIDIDTSSEQTSMLVAITLDNSIKKFVLSKGTIKEVLTLDLGKGGHWLFKHQPDGLLNMDNGDILVAAFGSGKILRIPWNSDRFGVPDVVADNLGHPTDLTIGRSTSSSGKSLFVTTKSGWLSKDESVAKGKVIEINME